MKSIDFFLKFEEMKSPRLANPSTQGSENPTGTLESESPLRVGQELTHGTFCTSSKAVLFSVVCLVGFLLQGFIG